MAILDARLYAGGPTDCSTPNAEWRYGMKWDGSIWRSMDLGITAPIRTIATGDGSLFVGSSAEFDADGMSASGLAIWKSTGSTRSEAKPIPRPSMIRFESVFPNPFSRRTTIRLSVEEASGVLLTASDMMGRRVASLNAFVQEGQHQIGWSPEGVLAAGRYVLEVTIPGAPGTGRDHILVVKQ
jgi:hypothetical protein